jgi:hypothetical protein
MPLSNAGCREVPNLSIFRSLSDGSDKVGRFAAEMTNETHMEIMEGTCGPIDEVKWNAEATTVSATMCGATVFVVDLLDVFQCSSWYDVYGSLAYDAVCYSVDSLSWIAFTQLFTVCFAFVIVTCRVSIYQGIEISSPPVLDNTKADAPFPCSSSQRTHLMNDAELFSGSIKVLRDDEHGTNMTTEKPRNRSSG